MAKRTRQKPMNVTLTVRIDLNHDQYDERWVRDELLPPRAFDALALALTKAVLRSIHVTDVQRISVGEPARPLARSEGRHTRRL